MSVPGWQRRTVDVDLTETFDRIKRLEAVALEHALDGSWVYVGTAGLDGVDSLLTLDSPPFENGWTNTLGPDAPVSFRRTLNDWVHIRGGFDGGADGTVVFTLPVFFRPVYRAPIVIPTSSPAHYATCYIEPTGEVVFGTVV